MSHALAVFAPSIGVPSETFIRRHMVDLLPGRTAIVAEQRDTVGQQATADVRPTLTVAAAHVPGLRGRIARNLTRLAGRDPWQRAVGRFLCRHGVEVVLAEYLDYALRWLPLARQLGLRFFAHAHGYDISRRLREAAWAQRYRDELRHADGIITMSHTSQQRLIDLGLPAERIHVVPYGVDVPPAPVSRTSDRTIVRCIAVGRMVAKKAPLVTLRAFRAAATACPSLHLDFVGTGDLMGDVERAVVEQGLGDRATLHGAQPNERVGDLMRRADIFVQHSIVDPATGDEEGLPVAILEAMAAGLPVVATRHAGIPEAVVDGVTGFLVDEGDDRAMSDRLVTLASEVDLWRSMGLAGWMRCRDRFAWPGERSSLLRIMGLDAAGPRGLATVSSRSV